MTLTKAEKITKRKFTLTKSDTFPSLPKAKTAFLENFGDARAVGLDLYDNQIFSVIVTYKSNIEWNDLRDFAETSVKALELPLSRLTMKSSIQANLFCSPVFFAAEKTVFGYQLIVTDSDVILSLSEIEKEQRRKLEEVKKKKKTVFKP